LQCSICIPALSAQSFKHWIWKFVPAVIWSSCESIEVSVRGFILSEYEAICEKHFLVVVGCIIRFRPRPFTAARYNRVIKNPDSSVLEISPVSRRTYGDSTWSVSFLAMIKHSEGNRKIFKIFVYESNSKCRLKESTHSILMHATRCNVWKQIKDNSITAS
jgi:hypothetical protein